MTWSALAGALSRRVPPGQRSGSHSVSLVIATVLTAFAATRAFRTYQRSL
ncbi:MAG TPA: hypothetical protein VFQ44_13995 [Streptosporangiaceae bacterium]|nr:hypothetical protein [Streptosporangiaceae bacterium]